MTLDRVPLWVVFATAILIVLIAIEVGYRMGIVAHRRADDEKESPVSAISAAVLGLVAFMLAFTFGIATDRYDTRKQLVRDEANAIRTAWHRADFLPEPDRVEANRLFLEYLDLRLNLAGTRDPNSGRIEEALSATGQIQRRLWDIAVANARKDMNSDVAALYIESLNEVFAIHALRVAVGLQARIPTGIWLSLVGITILGMMAVGYHTGISGSKRSMSRPFLALSFAIVIVLIASLDRPNTHFIEVTQQPLIDVHTQIAAGPGSRDPVD